MGECELRAMAERLLREARALRAAFPNVDAMRVAVGEGAAVPPGGAALRAALRYLRDEMAVVRDGRADSLVVLDDEIANVERLAPRP